MSLETLASKFLLVIIIAVTSLPFTRAEAQSDTVVVAMERARLFLDDLKEQASQDFYRLSWSQKALALDIFFGYLLQLEFAKTHILPPRPYAVWLSAEKPEVNLDFLFLIAKVISPNPQYRTYLSVPDLRQFASPSRVAQMRSFQNKVVVLDNFSDYGDVRQKTSLLMGLLGSYTDETLFLIVDTDKTWDQLTGHEQKNIDFFADGTGVLDAATFRCSGALTVH
jgi:hypothetical protein